MTSFELRPIDSEQDLQTCFPVMQELRPHLTDLATFIAQVRRQADQGYRLLAAWRDHQALGLAGYRLQENLIYGRFLYVDDLVTTAQARGHGVGEALIDALRDTAKQRDCAHFVLDTGLANDLAQRFYFRQGLLSKGLHFCQPLSR